MVEGLDPADIALAFPPYLSRGAVGELSAAVGIPRSRFIDLDEDTDPFTSSLPYAFERARQHGLTQPGDIALIITVGSGIEVGCTTYRF
jgi:3-oxoacyl-[acyl-carrier-protein] synthase III